MNKYFGLSDLAWVVISTWVIIAVCIVIVLFRGWG